MKRFLFLKKIFHEGVITLTGSYRGQINLVNEPEKYITKTKSIEEEGIKNVLTKKGVFKPILGRKQVLIPFRSKVFPLLSVKMKKKSNVYNDSQNHQIRVRNYMKNYHQLH